MENITYLFYDNIPSKGGNIIVTSHICQQIAAKNYKIASVKPDVLIDLDIPTDNVIAIKLPKIFNSPKFGHYFLYLIKKIYEAIQLRLLIGKYNPKCVLGCAGFTLDLPIYIVKLFSRYRFKTAQFIHGTGYPSRMILWAVKYCDIIFCLPKSIQPLRLFAHHKNLPPIHVLINGLPKSKWPNKTHSTSLRLFWCASLYRWKKLDVFLAALKKFPISTRPPAEVCYISSPEVSDISIYESVDGVTFHQDPKNLDKIRANCTIFVSTSEKEPFGLSILESMAAGLCVVIPSDGAYWDTILVNKESCIKYQPNNPKSLYQALNELILQPNMQQKIAQRSFKIAQNYVADNLIQKIILPKLNALCNE